jgi:transcriptional regulator with XRE-family HTH domain
MLCMICETFGQRLRRIRNDRGISRIDLAFACVTTAQFIAKLEAGGLPDPGLELGLRLALVLHVDPYELALGEVKADPLRSLSLQSDSRRRRGGPPRAPLPTD